jgi:hypothetical protein
MTIETRASMIVNPASADRRRAGADVARVVGRDLVDGIARS